MTQQQRTAPSYPLAGWASPANMLTFLRIVLSPVLFWLILEAEATVGTSWAAFTLGWFFGVTDLFDGKVARWTGQVSKSGAFLDPLADKIVVLGCGWSLVAVDRFHWLPIAIITIRELWISLFRISWARQGLSIPARPLAKWKTVIQGLVICAAITPTFEDQQLLIDLLIWGAVVITVITGWHYLRDGEATASATGQ